MAELKLNIPYPILAFDTETGGLNADNEISWSLEKLHAKVGESITGRVTKAAAPILEIGAIFVSPSNLEEVSTFHTLCGPEKGESIESFIGKCTKQALEINGFKDRIEELKNAPPLSEAMKNFVLWLPKKGSKVADFIPCGQNVRFDIEMVNNTCKRFGINFEIRKPPLELISYSQLYFALPDTEIVANYKLTTVSQALGVSIENAHSALADVKMTLECMRKMFKRFSYC